MCTELLPLMKPRGECRSPGCLICGSFQSCPPQPLPAPAPSQLHCHLLSPQARCPSASGLGYLCSVPLVSSQLVLAYPSALCSKVSSERPVIAQAPHNRWSPLRIPGHICSPPSSFLSDLSYHQFISPLNSSACDHLGLSLYSTDKVRCTYWLRDAKPISHI